MSRSTPPSRQDIQDDIHEMLDDEVVTVPQVGPWPSGVGGVQCAACTRTTVCRAFSVMPEVDDADEEWLCQPCFLGVEPTANDGSHAHG